MVNGKALAKAKLIRDQVIDYMNQILKKRKSKTEEDIEMNMEKDQNEK